MPNNYLMDSGGGGDTRHLGRGNDYLNARVEFKNGTRHVYMDPPQVEFRKLGLDRMGVSYEDFMRDPNYWRNYYRAGDRSQPTSLPGGGSAFLNRQPQGGGSRGAGGVSSVGEQMTASRPAHQGGSGYATGEMDMRGLKQQAMQLAGPAPHDSMYGGYDARVAWQDDMESILRTLAMGGDPLRKTGTVAGPSGDGGLGQRESDFWSRMSEQDIMRMMQQYDLGG